MKKISFLFILLILVACTSPQTSEVLETSEVSATPPPTRTPIPTPTLHPDFIALQNLINSASDRFVLLPDGTLEETTADGGRKIVPNLYVDQNGIINIIFNNERVAIDQSQITFDDEKGLTIDGYELENGEWVEAEETVTLGGVTLTLDENGVVTEMSVEGNYTDEQKAEKLAKVDPTNWGFEAGQAQIVQEGVKLYITPAGEPETKIASWYYGTGEWEWDLEVMAGLEGGNPLFNGFAKTYPTPYDDDVRITNEVRADAAEILKFALQVNLPGIPTVAPIYLYNGEDKSEAIVARSLVERLRLGQSGIKSEVVNGWVVFMTKSGPVLMRIKGEVFLRDFN